MPLKSPKTAKKQRIGSAGILRLAFKFRCSSIPGGVLREMLRFPGRGDGVLDSLIQQVIMAPSHGIRFVELVDSVRPKIKECTVNDVVKRQTAGDPFIGNGRDSIK